MYKEARIQFEKAEKDLTFVNQFRNFYNIALLNLAEGDRRTAFTYLAKSIKEKEDYCLAHFKLGELYSEEFKYTQEVTEKFSGTRFGTLASVQVKRIQENQSSTQSLQTEVIKTKDLEDTTESPRF